MTTSHITEFHQRDLPAAQRFAVQGMHLDRYTSNTLESYLYGKLATYQAFDPATIALGAYVDQRLVGFIFARITSDHAHRLNWHQRLYVRLAERVIAWSPYQAEATAYDQANQQMFRQLRDPQPDAEITFFAVDPQMTGHHIGSQLLAAVEHRLAGKRLYLYTDSSCNYPFYFKRGFTAAATRTLTLPPDNQELTCYLLTKQLAAAPQTPV